MGVIRPPLLCQRVQTGELLRNLTKFNLLYIIMLRFLTKVQMTVTTESGGRQNAFPTETRPYIDESVSYEGYPQNAEKVNGRWAMIGFVALIGAYAVTGQIIPGVF